VSLDLGDLATLASALGLLNDRGDLTTDWFSQPGDYLTQVLREAHQREALVTFAGDLLGGGQPVADSKGRQWLPVAHAGDGVFTVYAVIGPDGPVIEAGAGARLDVTSAGGVRCQAEVHVPLFGQPTAGGAATVLIGSAAGTVDVTLELTLPSGTQTAGVALGGARFTASVPTDGTGPAFGLVLTGLQLPGAAAPADLAVTVTDLASLEHSLIHLVMGLVQAEFSGLPDTDPLRGLATMLGLVPGAVPAFPVEALLAHGPGALADWLAAALGDPGARAAWLGGVAALVGGQVSGTGAAQVDVTLDPAELSIGINAAAGASGRPRITPTLTLSVTGAPGVTLALEVDPVSIDLGTGAAVAVPALRLTGQLRGAGGPLLPAVTGPAGLSVEIGGLDAGFALDAARRPTLVLQALNATVGASQFAVLDLSSPDALAAAAQDVVAGAAGSLLRNLGPAAVAAGVLLGLADPPGGPVLPKADPVRLLSDPLGALRGYWDALLTAGQAEVQAVLEVLRDAVADAAQQAVGVTGSGTAGDPWLLPLTDGAGLGLSYEGGVLAVGLAGTVGTGDLAGSGLAAALTAQVRMAELGLSGPHTGRAAFLPGASGALRFTRAGGGALTLGEPPVALTATAAGIGASWSTGTGLATPAGPPAAAGLQIVPVAEGVALLTPAGQIALPELGPGAAAALTDELWAAVESLVAAGAAALAQAAAATWPLTVVNALGWGSPGASTLSGPYLSLAALVADPAAALRAEAAALADVTEGAGGLLTLLDVLAELAGTPVARLGSGQALDPWRLPLLGDAADAAAGVMPALFATVEPAGPDGPATLLQQGVASWQPGDPDLAPETLISALATEAGLDPDLAGLLAGRGDVLTGLGDLTQRWLGTDGLVNLPDSGLPDGVTGHQIPDLAHPTPLGDLDLAAVDGLAAAAAAATVVHIAVVAPGLPVVLAAPGADGGPAADHALDLTAAGRAPASFGPPQAADPTGLWTVALGPRAVCRLDTGDPDGVAGQTARLAAVLPGLVAAAGGPVLVVAHGAAGHPAVRAATGLAGVAAVVTVGTPWSPVSADTLDRLPGAESLRLLAGLVPAADPDEPDDPDLALARAVTGLWMGLDPLGDPLAELRPPAGPTVPAGGTPVHALAGALTANTLGRAVTAAVAAGLSVRAAARAEAAATATGATGARAGLRLPLLPPVSRAGLTCAVHVDLELGGFDLGGGGAGGAGAGGPSVTGPAIVISAELGSAAGWLVGGPDPGRTPGTARPLALRRLTARVRLPLALAGGAAGSGASSLIVLHDATAFGVRVPRWNVAAGPGAPAGATTALPEVRALLAEVATRIDQAAAGTAGPGGTAGDPVMAGLRDALAAIGLLSAGGATGTAAAAGTALGIDPVTLDRLVLDPGGVAAAVRADAVRRPALAAALRGLAGDTRTAAAAGETVALSYASGPATVTGVFDLAGGGAQVTASGPGGAGWSLGAGIGRNPDGSAAVSGQLRIGPGLPDPGVPGGPAQGAALLLSASSGTGAGPAAGPFTVRVRTAAPSGTSDLTLWPAPDPAAIAAALESAVPVALLTAALAALRTRLTTAVGGSAATGALIDAVADALGLLGPAPARPPGSDPGDPPPARPLRLPAGLLADPGGWLRSLAPSGGTLAATVPALLDALRGIVAGGGDSTPGVLPIAAGLDLRATTAGGRLVLAAEVRGADFTAGGDVGRLVLGGRAGLSLDPAGGGPRPDVTLSLTVSRIGAIQLGVGPRADGTIGVTLSVHPDGGVDIPILPAGPGLGASAVAGAALKALPALLDTVAERDPVGDPAAAVEIAGRVVARLGDALGLRTGSPARFDPAALSTFGHDPAAALAARAPAIATQGLSLLADAASPLLGTASTRSVTTVGSAVVVTVGPVTLSWQPGSARVGASVAVPSGLPGVESLAASVAVDATGLTALDIALGPASLEAGPLILRPFARVIAGSAPPGGRAVEIGLGAGTSTRLVARIPRGGGAPSLISRTGLAATGVDSTDPAAVVLAALGAVLDLAGSVVLAVPAVSDGLDRPLFGTTARALLTGVLLDPAHPDHLDPSLLDPAAAVHRLGFLLRNLAAPPGVTITVAGALTLGPHARDDGAGGTVYGLTLGLSGPWALGGDDITVSLEPDAGWIVPTPAGTPGITVEVLALTAAGDPVPAPGIAVDGVAVRIARSSGALLDSVITIESVALSLFADILASGGAVTASGGAKLELAGLSASLGGASGGNAVAGGLLNSGSHDDAPKPRFSPALAIQKHGTDAAFVTFTAGDGTGPWWVVIQRGFGPIYIEQVGLAVTMPSGQLGSVGLLIDGKVSLLGLTAAVDDLSITYLVPVGSPLNPDAWVVDLAGLAVTADFSGLSLAGSLRKFPVSEGGVQYLGMLLAKLAVYGISVYGGYGLVGPPGDQYASLFLFGAVNGPIGGPPAFFVTGIGGGFGINRDLIYPSDLTQFSTYPFIKALDPAARPGDPMTELDQVRGFFPPHRGSFWFAAGVSFNSFALVDGVAVIAVQVGDGFELALLGLARMALPRPQVALVSIELALLARVSTKEGVVLVQAALTDNSWLLYPDIRLTGGFAFASWFGGPNRGQMVLTLGGYHPDFHRDGYPVVPRLGLSINLFGFLSITGQTYFALTSEAVMAGVAITASADFGVAWAHLRFGGDGIIFYDPFRLHISVYASISAGITIDVWIGTITISVSLSAQVDVYGSPFYGEATFSVGPSSLTVPFGDRPPDQPAALSWAEFVPKYLQEASAGIAHVLGAVSGPGAQVPAGSAATGGARTPDGSDASPFLVTPEFTLTVTSLAPVRELVAGGTTTDLPTVPEVSAAPMRQPARPTVTLAFTGPAHASPRDRIADLALSPQPDGSFPIGIWGPAQIQDDAKVPSGAVLTAVDRVQLTGSALWAPSHGVAPDIPLRQVETGNRRPLPFVTEGSASQLAALSHDAGQLAGTVPAAGPDGVLVTAADLLQDRGGRSPADVAAWRGGQRSQPILGSLGEGLGTAWVPAPVQQVAPPAPEPVPLRLPAVQAVLAMPVGLDPAPTVMIAAPAAPSLLGPAAAERPGAAAERASRIPVTTVVLRGPGPTTSVAPALLTGLNVVTSAPPVLASADSALTPAIPARLIRQPDPAVAAAGTVLSTGLPPVSRSGRSGTEAIGGRGGGTAGQAWLAGLTASLHGDPSGSQGGLTVSAGQVTVLHAPDADRDVDPQTRPALTVLSGAVRVVAVGPGAGLLADQTVQAGDTVPVPPGTRVLAVHTAVPAGAAASPAGQAQVYGWDPAAPLPYLGDEVLLTAGGIVVSAGRVPSRRFARTGLGWVPPGTLTDGASAVTTRFSQPVDTVAVAVEGGGGDDLALGLSGATRARDAAGQPVPPVLVADGPRAVAVYAVVPGTRPDGTVPGVDVTVATGPGRHLAGVAGSVGGGDSGGARGLAAAIAARGFAAVVPDPVPTGLGRAVVAWKQA
jgi:hypothetical protein